MNEEANDQKSSPTVPLYWRLLILACVLLAAAWLSLGYVLRERRQAAEMALKNAELNANLSQTRGQLQALTAKLNALSAPAPAPPVKHSASPAAHRRAVRPTVVRRPAEDPRWNQIKTELADQRKQISATQQEVEREIETARSELRANLNSTRDELSGSIARTHEELVSLEKKGERNYYEFDLAKSKEFQHAGPISISLRKADTKRQYCDLRLLVNDYQLTQKHLNLYEPVLFYPEGYPQALELVVNLIDKNRTRGYVSAPRYKSSEQVAGAAGASPAKPAAAASNVPAADLQHRQDIQR